MANKGGKKDDFQNTTAWLVAVVGNHGLTFLLISLIFHFRWRYQ